MLERHFRFGHQMKPGEKESWNSSEQKGIFEDNVGGAAFEDISVRLEKEQTEAS